MCVVNGTKNVRFLLFLQLDQYMCTCGKREKERMPFCHALQIMRQSLEKINIYLYVSSLGGEPCRHVSSFYPVIANRTFGNRTQSNSIELNRTQSMDWVRLSSGIEWNRTAEFVWVRFPNQSNSIEHNPMDCFPSVAKHSYWERSISHTISVNRTLCNITGIEQRIY